MSGQAGRLVHYLDHIQTAIARIQRYTAGMSQNQFLQDGMVQDAVIRNLEIVGEAARNIIREFPSFAQSHPELPLPAAYEMRNVVAHGYFKVDLKIVWGTIQRDLPDLQQKVDALLRDLMDKPPSGVC